MIGQRLKKLRELKEMSQRDLSAASEIALRQIWRYENEESAPNALQLKKLAETLEVSADYLLGLTDAPISNLMESDLNFSEYSLLVALRLRDPLQAIVLLADILSMEPSEPSNESHFQMSSLDPETMYELSEKLINENRCTLSRETEKIKQDGAS